MAKAPLIGAEPSGSGVAGYNFIELVQGDVAVIEARTLSGALAGRGCFVDCGDTAVFDQISTEPAHQRQGIGRAIVQRLAKLAAIDYADGLLVATEAGRGLYARLGWTELSRVVSIISP